MNIKPPAITGDIILIYQPKKNVNLILQSILRLGKARHSHVAIALSNFSLIHAMPKSGVCIQSLGEYLNKNKKFVVYRNKLVLLENKINPLGEYLQYHNLQSYSLLNLLFASWRYSFCSELAAKAYEKAGIKITRDCRKPKQVLPIDIYRYISVDSDWVDITHEYKEFFLDSDSLALMEKATEVEKSIVELTQNMGYEQQVLVDRINTISIKEGFKEKPITPPMSYWSNQLAKQQGFWSVILFVLSYWCRIVKEISAYLIRKNK